MKLFLIVALLFSLTPSHEVEQITFSLPLQPPGIIINYESENFSQKVIQHKNSMEITVVSIDFNGLDMNFPVTPNYPYIKTLEPPVQSVLSNLIENSNTLGNYLTHVSYFLENKIQYTEENLPQETEFVIRNRKANCIGLSNVTRFFLDVVGIKNRPVRGFYLEKGDGDIFIPQPHRWVEIQLSGKRSIFYDPQYRKFSSYYIATRSDVDFKKIKRFNIRLLKKSKKIII